MSGGFRWAGHSSNPRKLYVQSPLLSSPNWRQKKKKKAKIKYLSLKSLSFFKIKNTFLELWLTYCKIPHFKHAVQRYLVNLSSYAPITTIQLQNPSITPIRPLVPKLCTEFPRRHPLSTSHCAWPPHALPSAQLNTAHFWKPRRHKPSHWPWDSSLKGSTCFGTTTPAAECPSKILLWLAGPTQGQQLPIPISDPLLRPHP